MQLWEDLASLTLQFTYPLEFCRKKYDNTYKATTWQIEFKLDTVESSGTYTLRLALASAAQAELQVIKIASCVII